MLWHTRICVVLFNVDSWYSAETAHPLGLETCRLCAVVRTRVCCQDVPSFSSSPIKMSHLLARCVSSVCCCLYTCVCCQDAPSFSSSPFKMSHFEFLSFGFMLFIIGACLFHGVRPNTVCILFALAIPWRRFTMRGSMYFYRTVTILQL